MVRVDNKFSKLFKTYLGKDAVYNFINKTLKKVNINKEVEMIKEDNEDLRTLLNDGSIAIIMLMLILK